jgi:hypothetical protein
MRWPFFRSCHFMSEARKKIYSGLDRHDHGLINFMYIKYETLNCILKGTIHRTVFRNFVYMKFEL